MFLGKSSTEIWYYLLLAVSVQLDLERSHEHKPIVSADLEGVDIVM